MFKSSKAPKSEPVIVNNITPLADNNSALLPTGATTAQMAQSVNFTTSAFSIVKDGNAWFVVEIPLDPENELTGEWIIHPEDGTKMGAQERMKICVARKLFV